VCALWGSINIGQHKLAQGNAKLLRNEFTNVRRYVIAQGAATVMLQVLQQLCCKCCNNYVASAATVMLQVLQQLASAVAALATISKCCNNYVASAATVMLQVLQQLCCKCCNIYIIHVAETQVLATINIAQHNRQ
jgi:hypothetical protein